MNCTRLTPVLIALAGWLGTSPMAQAQSFTNGNTTLPTTYNSGGCVGFADLDGDGYDDLVILDQSRVLHTLYQAPNGTFTCLLYTSPSPRDVEETRMPSSA